jgi:hypothetical protein
MSSDKKLWPIWGGGEHSAFTFRGRLFKKNGLLDPDHEGNMLLRNVGNYLSQGLNHYQHDFVVVRSQNVVLDVS